MSDNANDTSARIIKDAIWKNLEYLCDNSTNLDKILRSLLSGKVIDLDQWDEITSETKYPKKSSRYEALYMLVVKKLDNKSTPNLLLQALVRSGNEHILTKLDLESAVNAVASNNNPIAVAEKRKKAIIKSLDAICENSVNLPIMLVVLQGEEVLSRSKCEQIKAEQSDYDSFRMLYNLVANNLCRKDPYEGLVKALQIGLNQKIIETIEASMH